MSHIHPLPALWLVWFALLPGSLLAASLPECPAVVSQANQQLAQQGNNPVKDEKALVNVLRTLNEDNELPTNYISSNKAKAQGWNGAADTSLWETWSLNKKVLGGDPWPGSAAGANKWFSADLDSVRGKPSNNQLIYNHDNHIRYLSTNSSSAPVKLPPCQ